LRPPGFLEITLDGRTVVVHHHYWTGDAWDVSRLYEAADLFGPTPATRGQAGDEKAPSQ
jgi:hypothetical protein